MSLMTFVGFLMSCFLWWLFEHLFYYDFRLKIYLGSDYTNRIASLLGTWPEVKDVYCLVWRLFASVTLADWFADRSGTASSLVVAFYLLLLQSPCVHCHWSFSPSMIFFAFSSISTSHMHT